PWFEPCIKLMHVWRTTLRVDLHRGLRPLRGLNARGRSPRALWWWAEVCSVRRGEAFASPRRITSPPSKPAPPGLASGHWAGVGRLSRPRLGENLADPFGHCLHLQRRARDLLQHLLGAHLLALAP